MQFLITMRDASTFIVEASYIEVVGGPRSSYTFLGPVPGYPVAILAAVPTEVVAAVRPLEQADPAAARKRAGGREAPSAPPVRPPLPPIAAADV